jgi:hypothetical protein
MVAPGELLVGPEPTNLEQLRLVHFNAQRLRPSVPGDDWKKALDQELTLRALEMEFLENERRRAVPLAREAPREANEFVAWFEALEQTGPGQHDPLFPYLAERATREEMCWFLTQEIAGEAGFDDLVALTQVKMPAQAKLELARNYWDEMGRGEWRHMHGVMLDRVAEVLQLRPHPEETVWESLALANLLAGLAANRCYAYHAVGALGVVELTAPGRVALVTPGLKRLGLDSHSRQYFSLHATLDVKHSEAWNREILLTLVGERPELASPIAEGAIMRLHAGARCFARYRRELGLESLSAHLWANSRK